MLETSSWYSPPIEAGIYRVPVMWFLVCAIRRAGQGSNGVYRHEHTLPTLPTGDSGSQLGVTVSTYEDHETRRPSFAQAGGS
mmetsp:Transcript_407/g.1393  ORF Transcript_407/g.1393 Transcript_407/m.1393 type:complete len:82 (+) Transcript_407:1308-1553(+)